MTFVLSWILFALLWWTMQSWHGGRSCVEGVDGFTTALLFSIETQHTIGYGSRAVTDRCSGAVTLLMFQSVFGAVTQCIITGIIFAKVLVMCVAEGGPGSLGSPVGKRNKKLSYRRDSACRTG